MNRNCALCALSLLAVWLVGCGGGTSSLSGGGNGSIVNGRKTGYFKIVVDWPTETTSKSSSKSSSKVTSKTVVGSPTAMTSKVTGKNVGQTRLIPSNTTRVVVTINDSSGNSYQQQTLTPPGSSAPVSSGLFALPINDTTNPSWYVVIQEYADPGDGSLSTVAIAEAPPTPLLITTANTSSAPATLSIAPHTDVATVALTGPTQVAGNMGPYSLSAKDSMTLTATALNASGAIVPVPSNAVTFASDNISATAIGNSAQNPVVITGQNLGVGNITATLTYPTTDPTTGLAGTPVTIVSNTVKITVVVKVIITPPASTTLPINTTTATPFTATVLGDATNSVTWSIDEGSVGGSITSTGYYTAPSVRGTYHVRAISVQDPTQSAVTTVTVQAGSASVSVK